MKPDLLLVQSMSADLEAALEEAYTVCRLGADGLPPPALASRVRAVVTGGGKGLPAAVWDQLPALEIIAVNGVGLDAVDLDRAKASNVNVAITPGVLTADVADLAIGLWLSLSRRMMVADAYVRGRGWASGAPLALSRTASGRAVGVLGLGEIGLAIAARATPFAREVIYHSRRPRSGVPYAYAESPLELARRSQVLFVATSGGAETRNLVDAAVLDALGPEGLLINVSRGTVVDEAALVTALEEGRLGGAGLDVFAHEPDVPTALLGREDVVLQPHRGSATVEGRSEMARLVLENLAAHFAARP
ncbi:MAG: 2-hydroxyacid dehydrogenase [Caulobacter sp.]|nr:2-hydroxyacid dehydrogenase [Caulobacter sp.]